jgi:hypothetical protein
MNNETHELPEILKFVPVDELGIPKTMKWDKNAQQQSWTKMDETQRSGVGCRVRPMNSQKRCNMTQEEKMQWRYEN